MVLGHKKTWKSIQLPSVDDKMNHSSSSSSSSDGGGAGGRIILQ